MEKKIKKNWGSGPLVGFHVWDRNQCMWMERSGGGRKGHNPLQPTCATELYCFSQTLKK